MIKSFESIFFSWIYFGDLNTGHGFSIKIGFGKYGLLFHISWGLYEKSRRLIIFMGFDAAKLIEWRIKRLMKKTTQEQRTAIFKALYELTLEEKKEDGTKTERNH